jgi:hypothetical protein
MLESLSKNIPTARKSAKEPPVFRLLLLLPLLLALRSSVPAPRMKRTAS